MTQNTLNRHKAQTGNQDREESSHGPAALAAGFGAAAVIGLANGVIYLPFIIPAIVFYVIARSNIQQGKCGDEENR